MIRRLLACLLCMTLILQGSCCLAGDREDHEKDLEMILLGRTLTRQEKDIKNNGGMLTPEVKFGYLEKAIYLCVDQMGANGKDDLDSLREYLKLDDFPESIQEITVPTFEHEKYTHLGWDYKLYPKQKEWTIRQKILLSTVSQVFGFEVENRAVDKERCTEMAKLIYYIHILGDHELNKLASSTQRIQLRNSKVSQLVDVGEDAYVKGLVNELRSCIGKLLSSRRTGYKYNRLMVKLNLIRFRSWITGEEHTNDDVDKDSAEHRKNEEKHSRIQEIAKDSLECLQLRLKDLLMEMDFFKHTFGSLVNNNQ